MRAWLRRRRWHLLALLGLYAMFVLFRGCADQLILFPNRQALEAGAHGVRRTAVPFQGGSLDVVIVERPGGPAGAAVPKAFVLAFTGNAGRVEFHAAADAEAWGNRPVELWAMNHPGFGQSTGPARLDRLGPAALAAYDALAAKAAGRPIFIAGTSLGCTMALHVAANRPVAGLLLRTPPPLQDLILRRFGWWNLWLIAGPVAMGVPSDLNALRTAPRVSAPALFLLIDTDDVVPLAYQQRVFDAYAGEKRAVRLADGDHNAGLTSSARQQWAEGIGWLWTKAGL